jgi:hypothetical protein
MTQNEFLSLEELLLGAIVDPLKACGTRKTKQTKQQ